MTAKPQKGGRPARHRPRRERLPAELRIRIWRRFGGICQHCYEPLNPWAFDVDHIKRVAGGGTSLISNLIPTHQVCNRRRGKRTVEEWRAVLRAEKSTLLGSHDGITVAAPKRGVRR